MYNRVTLASIILAGLGVIAPEKADAMTAEQCKTANWESLGFVDRLNGRGNAIFEDRKSDCEKKKLPMDVGAYDHGAALAMPVYCSPTFGLAYGSYGFSYNGSCPADLESEFLTAFNIGLAYFPAASAADKAQNALSTSQSLLDSAYTRYDSAVSTMNNSNASPEKRAKAAKNASKAANDIRTWQSAVSRDQVVLSEALRDLLRANAARESAIEGAGLFPPEDDVAQRDAYYLRFSPPAAASVIIERISDTGVDITVSFTAPPQAAPVPGGRFRLDAMTAYDFLAERGVPNQGACKVIRKTRRAIAAAAKPLASQGAIAEIDEIEFRPPAAIGDYRLEKNPPYIDGVLLLDDGRTPGEILIDAGVASRAEDGPDPDWYKDESCMS